MFIGVDVGGTNIRVAGVMNRSDPEFVRAPVRGRNSGDFETDVAFIVAAARATAGGAPIEALGMGSTGTLNHAKTQVLRARHNVHWVKQPVVELLEEALGCPVFFENDAVCAGLGEAYYGFAKGEFAYVVWGTGVGAVLMRDRGARVEFTDLNDRSAEYFRDWGRACGGEALVQAHEKPTKDFTAAEWSVVLKDFYEYLERFVARTKQKNIVLGGGLGVRHAEALMKMSTPGLQLAMARYGEDGGLYGAVALTDYRGGDGPN